MARRRRIVELLAALLVAFTLIAGVVAAVVVEPRPTHPDEWDPRVLELVEFVERERGARFEHPVHVEFLTAEAYSERTRTDSESLTDEEEEELERFEQIMRALGIVSGDTDLLEASNDLSDTGSLAYYDSLEERVVVRGTEVTPALAVTLVHELTHVLQDQAFALDRYEETDEEVSSGAYFAFRALVEGDAGRIERLYLDTLDDEALEEIDAQSSAELGAFLEEEVPVALSTLASSIYGLGDVFVAFMEEARGQSVNRAFEEPPTTEEHLLDPFSYLEGDEADRVEAPGTGGAEVLEEGDFGAVTLLVVLAERIEPRMALIAAQGWGGDAYTVFPRDGRTCIRVELTGDTPRDTQEIEDALSAWAAAATSAPASVSRTGELVSLESCDPGPGADIEGTGGSFDAVGIALSRSYAALGAISNGADEEQARCFADVLLSELTTEELALEVPTPELFERVAGLALGCR